MRKTVLNTLDSKTIKIVGNVESLVFENISPKANIKVVVERKGEEIKTPIATMPLGRLLELQDKIKASSFNRDVVRQTKNVAADGVNKIDVLVNAKLVLCMDGEFPIDPDTDTFTILLTNLGKVAAASSVTEFTGSVVGSRLYSYKKVNFRKGLDEKKVDINGVTEIFFDPASVPASIEVYFEGDHKVYSPHELKQVEHDKYNLVRMHENAAGVYSPVFGFAECLVLPLGGVHKVIFKDEAKASDIFFYTLLG